MNMSRGVRVAAIAAAVVAALMVAGNMAFVRQDERRAAAFGFAVGQSAAAVEQIARAAVRQGSLKGSGIGVAIADQASSSVGPTRWSVSPEGVIRGSAPERGLTVLLTPEMRDGNLTWHCQVEPEQAFLRGTCRFVGQAVR